MIGHFDICRTIRFTDDFMFLGWRFPYTNWPDVSFDLVRNLPKKRKKKRRSHGPKLFVTRMENSEEGGGAIDRGMMAKEN